MAALGVEAKTYRPPVKYAVYPNQTSDLGLNRIRLGFVSTLSESDTFSAEENKPSHSQKASIMVFRVEGVEKYLRKR
jgi:hypothetical protein